MPRRVISHSAWRERRKSMVGLQFSPGGAGRADRILPVPGTPSPCPATEGSGRRGRPTSATGPSCSPPPQYAPPAVLRVGARYRQLVNDEPRNLELDGLQVCFPIVFLAVLLHELERAAVRRRAALLVPNG